MENPVKKTLASFTNICLAEDVRPIFTPKHPDFSGDTRIHEFFYKQSLKHPERFPTTKDYIFSDRSNFHFSRGVYQDLINLEQADILEEHISTQLTRYQVTEKGRIVLMEFYKPLGKDQKRIYELIGGEFFEQFACNAEGKHFFHQ